MPAEQARPGPFCAGGWGAPAAPGRARSRYGRAQRPAPAHGPRPAAAAGARPGEAGKEAGKERGSASAPALRCLSSAPSKRGRCAEPARSRSGVFFIVFQLLEAAVSLRGAPGHRGPCKRVLGRDQCAEAWFFEGYRAGAPSGVLLVFHAAARIYSLT